MHMMTFDDDTLLEPPLKCHAPSDILNAVLLEHLKYAPVLSWKTHKRVNPLESLFFSQVMKISFVILEH